MKEEKTQNEPKKQPSPFAGTPGLLMGLWYALISMFLFFFVLSGGLDQSVRVPYSEFLSAAESGTVDKLVIADKEITGRFVKGRNAGKFFSTSKVDPELAKTLSGYHINFEATKDDSLLKALAGWIVPIMLVVIFWFAAARMGRGGMAGPGVMAMEKSGAKIYAEEKVKITFADVAGVDEAKEELKEVIGFLKQPERYWRLGGRLPKGILLVGPPGTGKTLLARAVAGEAGVPFFSVSGSQFVELFVGVGAARVRDLFARAAEKAPCIIFIDELDALGKARSANPLAGSHDEKEQTLNQLLVELDGFDPMHGVILLAATNRPEMLDTALLRAGRFDRQVIVDRPDKIGRAQILRVHLREVTIDPAVDIDGIAAATPGFTGADLANLVNEAVLLAVRRDAQHVEEVDLNAAIERIVAGLEKKNRLLNVTERRVVAHHEAGHALVSLLLPGTDPVQKVSIIPRGIGALGYTIQRPIEDRFLMSKTELENKMTVLLGGRAAEMLVFKETSTGAADDLVKATRIARSMVTRYGMSAVLGPVTYEDDSTIDHQLDPWHPTHFSDETAKEIDGAVRKLVEDASERATSLLDEHYSTLIRAAMKLLECETVSGADLAEILAIEEKVASETTHGTSKVTPAHASSC